jgi:hypothetical protein
MICFKYGAITHRNELYDFGYKNIAHRLYLELYSPCAISGYDAHFSFGRYFKGLV